MHLILPMGGRSSRYPGLPPKWRLTHPNGGLMITEAISGLDLSKVDGLYAAVLREHLSEDVAYDVAQIKRAFTDRGLPAPQILVLDQPTASQPETVTRILEHFKLEGSFLIKDCDNRFAYAPSPGNSVCAIDVHKMGPTTLGNKSFVVANEKLEISSIVEKQIISSTFCCGGYSFESVSQFCDYFYKQTNDSSLYVSHIIYAMLLDGHIFVMKESSHFEDWGTETEWSRYMRNFATLFIDIDGVLVKNSGRYFGIPRTEQSVIERNAAFLREVYDNGRAHIVLTSARHEDEREATLKQLEGYGIKFHSIVLGLPHSQRILINDYSATNPYPSSIAVNIERDDPTLRNMLAAFLQIPGGAKNGVETV